MFPHHITGHLPHLHFSLYPQWRLDVGGLMCVGVEITFAKLMKKENNMILIMSNILFYFFFFTSTTSYYGWLI